MPPAKSIPYSDYRSQVALLSLPSFPAGEQEATAQECSVMLHPTKPILQETKSKEDTPWVTPLRCAWENSLAFGQYLYIFKCAS